MAARRKHVDMRMIGVRLRDTHLQVAFCSVDGGTNSGGIKIGSGSARVPNGGFDGWDGGGLNFENAGAEGVDLRGEVGGICSMKSRRGDGVPNVEKVVSLRAGGLGEGGVEVVAEVCGEGKEGLVLVGMEMGGEEVKARKEGAEELSKWGGLGGSGGR